MRYLFGDCLLDTEQYALQRGSQSLPLRAKVFQVLHYLLTHRTRVVSKQELCEQIWAGQFVSDAALEGVIKAVRRIVGDAGRTQWCIQTRRGQGYRFVASVRLAAPLSATPEARSPSHVIVGREAELARLQRWWRLASQGTRQVGLVTGEAGTGKTALVQAFVDGARLAERVWVGYGQCLEFYGTGEAYLPLLDALGRLCRGTEEAALLALLRQYAPSWLAQMPTLLPAAERDMLQRLPDGAPPARMLRELAEAVEVLAAERPLLIVLEDLHWSDASTLDWLGYVARRRDPARLLVLGTYRPVEALARSHPLRAVAQELQQQQRGCVLEVGDLSPEAVSAYLAQRFGGTPFPENLSRALHQRTSGNPLFMVSLVDDLVQQGVLREVPEGGERSEGIEARLTAIPDSLRQLIAQRLERLEREDQRLLEAASVAGGECSTAAIAAGVDRGVDEVEERCDILARQYQFLQGCGMAEWPDGTLATRYRFRHALYREALYDRLPAGRRVHMHRLIGARLERGYEGQTREVAAELAAHFTHGRDARRALPYLAAAGEIALQRGAHQEAIAHVTQGLTLLTTLPDRPERAPQELMLLLALGNALIPVKGYTQDVEAIYIQAQNLCQRLGDTPQIFPALRGLLATYGQRGKLQTARAHAETFLRLARRQDDATLLLQAHRILASIWLFLGRFAPAREHVERSLALYDREHRRAPTFLYAQDPGVSCLSYMALLLWCQGYPDQALQRGHEALALAQELAQPHSLAFAHSFAATLFQLRREPQPAQRQAEASIALCHEQGFTFRLAHGTILRGWALGAQGQPEEGVAQIHASIVGLQAAGIQLALPYYLTLLAEGYWRLGAIDTALRVLDEALSTAQQTGERWCEAEVHRLQGECYLRQGNPRQQRAEACFHRALARTREHQARSWELRASVSLGRLWQRQGRHDAARQLVAAVYGRLTEGFDTADVREARALLEELIEEGGIKSRCFSTRGSRSVCNRKK
jgi:predicted ATPase/DNA-binding winged helix-turn-helix (wHTH) protein